MLTTNNDQLASKVRTLINHGIDKNTFQREKEKRNYFRAAVLSGFNFRLSNILATIGVEQMKKIDRMNDLRRQHSLYFNNQLSSISELDLPVENEDSLHVYQMYTIKVNKGDRNDVVAYLRGQNVEASVHFYPPVHLHPAYSDFRNLNLPVTDRVAMRIITLPMFPMLKREELDNIINFLKDYFARK